MRRWAVLCLPALLLGGSPRAFGAAFAAPLRLDAAPAGPIAPLSAAGLRVEPFRSLALSLLPAAAPALCAPAPVPAVRPAVVPAAPAAARTDPAVPSDYLPIPITVQETDYSCGAAAALSVLRYWQAYSGGEASLYETLGTSPKDGTPPDNIARALTQLGVPAELRENMTLDDLRAALRRGDTVILDIQAWRADEDTPWSQRWDDGHYVVLSGMDERYAYLMDPSTEERYTYLSLAELLERWHDYEDRGGQVRRYYQTGIVARGAMPLPRPAEPPASPEPIKLKRGPRSLRPSR